LNKAENRGDVPSRLFRKAQRHRPQDFQSTAICSSVAKVPLPSRISR
jgi:hypothetical protein